MVLRTLIVLGLLVVGCDSRAGVSGPQSSSHSDSMVQEPSAPRERVRVEGTGGVPLIGTLRRSPTPGAPAVIFLHQLASTRAEWDAIVDALAEAPGLTLLALDLRGHGESVVAADGTPLAFVEFNLPQWHALPRDVVAAVDWLTKQEGLSPSRVVVAGSSIGSSAALIAASSEPRITAVAAISPGRSYRGLEVLAAVPKLGDRPIWLLASKRDRASLDAAQAIAAAAPRARLLSVEGSAHGLSILDAGARARADLLAFLRAPEVPLDR